MPGWLRRACHPEPRQMAKDLTMVSPITQEMYDVAPS